MTLSLSRTKTTQPIIDSEHSQLPSDKKLNDLVDESDLPCECGTCAEENLYFECPGCLRENVPYCQGGSDEYSDYCTPCWHEITSNLHPVLKVGDIMLVNTSRTKNERFQITGFQESWINNKTYYGATTESLNYPGYFKLFPVDISDIDSEQEIF